METLEFRFTDDPNATDIIRSTCPGRPAIVFSEKPKVNVVLDNPIPRNGLFTITSDISNGETTQTFTEKIAKIVATGTKNIRTNNKNSIAVILNASFELILF